MSGATGNYYCGLHEFEDMSFLLHFLRPGDLFVDVGANVGSYTVLASAHCESKSVSIEPIPSTFGRLAQNIYLNQIEEKVDCVRVGIGAESGTLFFTSDLDAGNHVVENEDLANSISIPVTTLDKLLGERMPDLIKIDVEGFEFQVLKGAKKTLQGKTLRTLIIESIDPDDNSKSPEGSLVSILQSYGFAPFSYNPWKRQLTPGRSLTSNNTLFIRDVDWISKRLVEAPRFKALEIKI